MLRRTLLLALAALPVAGFAAGGNTHGRSQANANRVVIQVNEEDGRKWLAILTSIRNIQSELGKGNSAIALVAIGPGLGMLKADSVVANEVQDAIKTGVEFIACGNSMHTLHVERDDLVDGIGITKAGYVELMKRQQQGWIYLRP
jgi:intracellular sulfur oxidation DsrE/DsrF family protein